MQKYYWDTSIWLDLFENRDEPNFPKGEWAEKLMGKIIKNNDKIIYSDLTLVELEESGYSIYEIDEMLKPIKKVLIFVESSNKEIGRAKDLAAKRSVPRGDALHAILARNNNSILITLDNHFKGLTDITISHKPNEFI